MAAKMVTRRQTKSRDLEAASREHAAAVAVALRARLTPALAAGRELPDFEHLLHLLSGALDQRAADLDLVTADHDDREARKATARKRRNEAAKAVRAQLVAIRSAVAGVYGPEVAAEALGFENTGRLDNQGLVATARKVMGRLAAGPLDLPAPRVKGAQIEPADWLDDLTRMTNELVDTLEALSGSSKRTEHQLIGKHASLAEFDQLYNHTAGVVKALMIYAGLPAHAQRLRPTAPKPAAQNAPEPGAPPATSPTP